MNVNHTSYIQKMSFSLLRIVGILFTKSSFQIFVRIFKRKFLKNSKIKQFV